MKLHFPVRLHGVNAEGSKFVRLADTVDISPTGCRLSGVYLPLASGSVVELQHGKRQARFRVVWTGKMGSRSAGEVGLCALEDTTEFWGTNFDGEFRDDYDNRETRCERRKHERFDCSFGVDLACASGPIGYVTCTDLSRGGCYLETWSPLPVGTEIEMTLRLPNGKVWVRGIIRTTDPTFGMGAEFNDVHSAETLESYLSELSNRVLFQSLDLVNFEQEESMGMAKTVTEAELASAPVTTVLLADDSRFLRSAYSMYLRRHGFEVLVADNGDEALHLALTERPDVIILDLLMPKTGGVGALLSLKQNSETASIPVIVLSGLPSSNAAKLRSVGAFAYLSKTEVGPEELPTLVSQAVAGHVRTPGLIGQSVAQA